MRKIYLTIIIACYFLNAYSQRVDYDHTSKWFLGFNVGATINPCTKGLWVWNRPVSLIDKNTGEAFKVLIVDSEGIGAFNEDENHDSRIFEIVGS